VEGFNRVIVNDVSQLVNKTVAHSSINRYARIRIWKEVADVYEIFLVGYCGRALPSNALSAVTLKADISLDMTILTTLSDKILKSRIDAPVDVIFSLCL